jgi:hypothetical protein
MALVLFLIVSIIHQIFYVQAKKKSGLVNSFLAMAFFGLNVLWLLFALYPNDITKLYLMSTSTFLYIFLIPVYVSFYLKQRANEYKSLISLEQYLQLFLNKKYVYKKDDQYFLTGWGRFLFFFVSVGKKIFKD